jgi:hypothetical protein
MTMSDAQTELCPHGELVLGDALRIGVPVAAFLGQSVGWKVATRIQYFD